MQDVVIGLEVHVRLDTGRKLFCACVPDEGGPRRTCPVCRGEPGELPVVDPAALVLAARAALALGMAVHPVSRWDRKHYAWPDLPRSYQITQQRQRLASGGRLHAVVDGTRRAWDLRGLHVEEDAGRFTDLGLATRVDDTRAGAPLVELVTEPTLDSPEAAEAALRHLHRTLVAAGVTRGRLERGELRCDANISLREPDGTPGPRVELKNLGSFRWVRDALGHEIGRQRSLRDAGRPVTRETRQWDGTRTVRLRSKEATADYRWLPEADLLDVVLSERDLARAAAGLSAPLDVALLDGDLARRTHLRDLGVPADLVAPLADDVESLAVLDEAVALGTDATEAARWLLGPVRAASGPGHLDGAGLAEAIARVADGRLTRAHGVALVERLVAQGGEAATWIAREGWGGAVDPAEHVAAALAAHPEPLARWRAGDDRLLGFFMGEVLQRAGRGADPTAVRQALLRTRDEG